MQYGLLWRFLSSCGFGLALTCLPVRAQSTPLADKLCRQPGTYAVIAQRALPRGQRQQHIFFCDRHRITANLGVGPKGRIVYSEEELKKGELSDETRIDTFTLASTQQYPSGTLQTLLNPEHFPLPANCTYSSGAEACERWFNQLRSAFWFLGRWAGIGAECGFMPFPETVQITIQDSELVAIKTADGGNPCVPTGQASFRGSIPEQVTPSSRTEVWQAIASKSTPEGNVRRSPLTIIDANSFMVENTRFVRQRE